MIYIRHRLVSTNNHNTHMQLLTHGVECNIGNLLRVCDILQLVYSKIKYEKRGKYLPTFHEATCDNYFAVKCLLKSNVGIVILLIINWVELV